MKNLALSEKHGMAVVTLLVVTGAQAQTSDTQRIEQLERQVAILQQKQAMPTAERVRFNGFLSVGYGRASNNAGYGGYLEDYSLEDESRLGLQGTFNISASTEVVMQLVARGIEEWDPDMEWAYISHKFNNTIKARAGKMRQPLFMYSDSLEVGYAQPWARPPIEVYGQLPFSTYTGVDGIYDWNFGNSTLSAQPFIGQTNVNIEGIEVDVRDITGGSLTWTDFVWTLRGVYSAAEVVLGAEALDASFYGFGAAYNNGNWHILGEFTNIELDGPTTDTRSAYITAARRFGSLTPYVTVAMIESTDDGERPLSAAQAFALLTTPGSPFYNDPNILTASDLNNIERTATGVGLRWDALTNVAIKFDVTRTSSFGDTGGGLPGNLTAPERQYSDATLYTIKLDAVF